MESAGIAEEDDDEEALVGSPRKRKKKPIVVYDIVYSPSYRVPVLYLTLKHAPGANIYELLVPVSHQPQMQNTGLSGSLSLTDHPVTGLPVYFVHPCRTAEAMAAVRGVSSEGPIEYLMLWFGLVGSSVGLAVPVALAEALRR
ncbi:hypothetical protein B0A55_12189 [Friedmanniomyces simplex]|uniref:Ubiquitin-like-conjugating enzyme ATG10 n=1 Tax=Friedmanniomyces simplex TaxID=329884 RepID=A0A4U0VPP1_9PEZI|nr:hypothetical protein B0A55_12189 [Friedmanniomyces simplex]